MTEQNKIINGVDSWLRTIVIAENFCPFAKYPYENKTITYRLFTPKEKDLEQMLIENSSALIDCLQELDKNPEIETTLLIMNQCWENFDEFLVFIETADEFIDQLDYRGTYQLAHFHPDYQFAGVDESDAQNFTNRSPAPIIHILRESSISRALETVEEPSSIPQRNIRHAKEKGADYFQKKLKKIQAE